MAYPWYECYHCLRSQLSYCTDCIAQQLADAIEKCLNAETILQTLITPERKNTRK